MTPPPTRRARPDGGRFRVFVVVGVLVALALAGVVSQFASNRPDGLDAVTRSGCTFDAADRIVGGDCPARNVAPSGAGGSPLAGYSVGGVAEQPVGRGLAGVSGVVITLVLGYLVLRGLARPTRARSGGRDRAAGHRGHPDGR